MSVSKIIEQAFDQVNHPKTTPEEGEKMVNEIKYTLMKLDKMKVSISNTMVLGAQPYSSALEAKLIRIILSQVRDQHFEGNLFNSNSANFTFSAKVTNLADKLYPDKKNVRKSFYQDIQKAARNLNTRDIIIKDKETGEWIALSWTSAVSYNKGMVTIKLSEEVLPYISNLNRNFSVFPLDTLLSFGSKYSMRLYEGLFAKINRDTATRKAFNAGDTVQITFDLDEFRIVSSTVGMYGNLYNLKVKCIEPSIKEISKNTDLIIENYTCFGRHGRKVDSISFDIKKNCNFAVEEIQDEKAMLLVRNEGIFDDAQQLTDVYAKGIFTAFGLKDKKARIKALVKVYAGYGENTHDFNMDFKTAFQNASVDVAGYMEAMLNNHHRQDMLSDFMKGRDINQVQVDLFSSAEAERVQDALVDYTVQGQLRQPEEAVFTEVQPSPEEKIAIQNQFNGDNAQEKTIFAELREDAAVDLIYVTRVLNGLDCYYTTDSLKEIITLYTDRTGAFNANIQKAVMQSASDPVKYIIAAGHKEKKAVPARRERDAAWLNERFERDFQEIIAYWDFVAGQMREDQELAGGEVHALKPIHRTDIRHKRYIHALYEEGETVDSIKEAIDTAAASAFFLRTQGSFNFFINPKNYFDIAAGERDYDTEAAALWRLENR